MLNLDDSMEQSKPDDDATNGSSTPTVAPRFVGDVMTRDVKTLAPDQSFGEVVSLLAGNSFHHIIIAVDGHLMGMLSDRDVYRQLGRVADWSAKKIGEIMVTNTITVNPDTQLSEAAEKMLQRRINCLPVIDGEGNLVKVITSTDILRLYKTMQGRVEQAEL